MEVKKSVPPLKRSVPPAPMTTLLALSSPDRICNVLPATVVPIDRVAAVPSTSPSANTAVEPLSIRAFWVVVGGLPSVQLAGVNQFASVVGPFQVSCPCKVDDPSIKTFRLRPINQHWADSQSTRERLKLCTTRCLSNSAGS